MQRQIAAAARRLCGEDHLSRQARRQRKHAVQREEEKLRALQRCLRERRRSAGAAPAARALGRGEPPPPPPVAPASSSNPGRAAPEAPRRAPAGAPGLSLGLSCRSRAPPARGRGEALPAASAPRPTGGRLAADRHPLPYRDPSLPPWPGDLGPQRAGSAPCPGPAAAGHPRSPVTLQQAVLSPWVRSRCSPQTQAQLLRWPGSLPSGSQGIVPMAGPDPRLPWGPTSRGGERWPGTGQDAQARVGSGDGFLPPTPGSYPCTLRCLFPEAALLPWLGMLECRVPRALDKGTRSAQVSGVPAATGCL